MYGDIETMEDDPLLMEKIIRTEMITDGELSIKDRKLLPEVLEKREKVCTEMNNLLF